MYWTNKHNSESSWSPSCCLLSVSSISRLLLNWLEGCGTSPRRTLCTHSHTFIHYYILRGCMAAGPRQVWALLRSAPVLVLSILFLGRLLTIVIPYRSVWMWSQRKLFVSICYFHYWVGVDFSSCPLAVKILYFALSHRRILQKKLSNAWCDHVTSSTGGHDLTLPEFRSGVDTHCVHTDMGGYKSGKKKNKQISKTLHKMWHTVTDTNTDTQSAKRRPGEALVKDTLPHNCKHSTTETHSYTLPHTHSS